MTDAAEWCATLGCEGDPVDGEEHCRECIDTSPGLVDDPEAGGEAINPAGRTSESTDHTGSAETAESPNTAGESPAEGDLRDENPTPDADKNGSRYGAPDADAIAAVGTLGDGEIQALGNHDFVGWYQSRDETRPETIREGFARRGKPWLLADDYPALSEKLDRVLYASINYQDRDAVGWQPFDGGENGKNWKDDDKPTPGYGDLAAIAPFADVDLADEHKERPLPPEKRETVERALAEYRDEFADLAGDPESVFVLDSVGGVYLFVAPASTRPIAEAFDGDDRARVFDELTDRVNAWLDDVRERVNQRVPDAVGLFEPDLLNNTNRLYKAPLSLHSSIDGVVHPLDASADRPAYDFAPVESADDALADETRAWGERFTDDKHAERIESLVATLWAEYDDADGWRDALDAWLADEREREREREIQRAAVEQRREERECDLADVERTEHFADVIEAIEGIDVRRLARDVAAEYDTDPGRDPPRFAPSWRSSSSGTSCFVDRDGYTDLKEGGNGGNAVTLVARARGLIHDSGARVTGVTFWDAVDELRALDYDVPEYDAPESDDAEPVAVLPNSPRARAAANGWDWMSADRGDDALSVDDARERTRDAIADAYERGDRGLVEALPTTGKSYGAVAAAADAGEPITMLTTRGNREQYEQILKWCDEHDLRAKVLPSFHRDCETANGELDDALAETVKEWYRRGATGKDIHKNAGWELGKPLPCDGPAGARCSYKAGWQFDAEEYDVLVGNYLHAHVESVTHGRTVVFDEFPGDAFETALGGSRLAGAVTRYLKTTDDALPFDDYADLLETRDDPERRARALAHFDDHDPERDTEQAFATDGHAIAPLATYTILAGAGDGDAGRDLGNGWERATLPESGHVGLFDRENGSVRLLTPPDLNPRYTRGVVALDGTPTTRLWELAIGEPRLNHRSVLTDGERAEYVRDTLGLNIVRTTDAVKPYSGDVDRVADDQDAALLDGIADEHGSPPALLTTLTGERSHETAGLYETDGDGGLVDGNGLVDDLAHYGDLKGSNRFKSTRVGAVIGSRHFGDGFVKKWGGFAGEAVERDGDGKGTDLSYTGIGDDVLRHMTEHETIQAVMRFGRDGGGATVYVHTNTLPDWIEESALAGQGRVIRTYSDGERQLLDALDTDAIGDEWTTAEAADHPAVEIGESQVRRHLHALADRGHVAVDVEGNGFVWRDDGLHRVAEHGEVELAAVELDELDEQESDCIARSSIYTWDAITSAGTPPGGGSGENEAGDPGDRLATDGGDRPPDTPD